MFLIIDKYTYEIKEEYKNSNEAHDALARHYKNDSRLMVIDYKSYQNVKKNLVINKLY